MHFLNFASFTVGNSGAADGVAERRQERPCQPLRRIIRSPCFSNVQTCAHEQTMRTSASGLWCGFLGGYLRRLPRVTDETRSSEPSEGNSCGAYFYSDPSGATSHSRGIPYR